MLCKHSGGTWAADTVPVPVKLQALTSKTNKDTKASTDTSPKSANDLNPKDLVQPYALEGGSVSLGDQFTECEQEEDIIRAPDFGSVSPPDKEFLLPKSLSEELTQEMRDLKQKTADETDCKYTRSRMLYECYIIYGIHQSLKPGFLFNPLYILIAWIKPWIFAEFFFYFLKRVVSITRT